ncbi:MAG: tetratricopeptide repeat protein [Magnetococcus sp. YQC-5]
MAGHVEFKAASASEWKTTGAGQILHAGDQIRTGTHSRVSLLLADESLIKLKENSNFSLGDVAPSAGWTMLESKLEKPPSIQSQFTLMQGGVWFLNKNREVAITFKTPTATIGVRGTELVVELDPTQTLQVASLEGSAMIQNTQGEVVISSGEEAITRPGAAPVKQLLLHPENAVQWIVAVPSLFIPQDLKQSGPGWSELKQGRFAEALAVFEQNRKPESVTLMGRMAALMALHRFKEAEGILTMAREYSMKDPLFALQQAWFDLMTGEIVRANQALVASTTRHPQEVMGWQLRTLTALALDHREEMQESARQAITHGARSATSWIIHAYVQQARFLLDGAESSIHKALTLEPENVTALMALARLQFGNGRTSDALATMNKAAKQAPENAEVNNLHGYVLFSMHKDEEAILAFQKAAKQDTTLAEARMGLGLTFMRQGETARAFEEITTAVLLDPRRSLIRSYWAKMLYQVARHDKALDVLKMARTLDPRDPTPLLYEAVILRDLNKPTEAIQTINQAIVLNDNRAVYRSRFLLDGDLAVKNVDLSKLFNQLDLSAWARNKAVASVRQDYANSAGHLFYAGSLNEELGRSWARSTEALLARLLQPANLNTFDSFNNYTTFIEKPGMTWDFSMTAGNHKTFNQLGIASGAAPEHNLAYQFGYFNNDTDGWRKGHFDRSRILLGYMKWDGLPNGNVMLAATKTDASQGDKPSPRFEWDSVPSPRDNKESTTHRIEGGYHHHFAPGSDLLLHATQMRTPYESRNLSRLDQATLQRFNSAGATVDLYSDLQRINNYYQLQGEYLRRSGNNQMFAGVIHYQGDDEYNNRIMLEMLYPMVRNIPLPNIHLEQKRAMQTVFLQDIFKINPFLILEGDLHYNRMSTGNFENQTTWTESQWGPRMGLIWTPHQRHTLRLAGFRSMLPFISDRLDPVDIAGVPIHRNGPPGSLTDEGQLVWEYETKTGLWSTSLFHADREYSELTPAKQMKWESRIKGVELQYNRLLGMGMGLSGRYRFEQVYDPQTEQGATVNRDEHLAEMALKWVDSHGWSAKAKETYRFLDFVSNRAHETIWVTDLEAAYEFPKKWGSLQLKIDNLFDERFNWVTDAFVSQGRDPAREVFLTLNVSF